ncbi:MAG: Gfo/Idh/MocA family oxidoreductase, partial [Acidobacteriota bacterium]|nr:Gfo/Idh/MocA family oxidoreductase [Acidobacteriota bacterium]
MRYKIALIGTGYMARKHCDVLAQQPCAELQVVCSTERSREAGEKFKEQYGFAGATSDFGSVLSDSEVDLVFVCSPDGTHPRYAAEALRAGKHVFCEKPLGRTRE